MTFTPYVNGKLPELPEGVGFHLADFVQTIFQQDYEAVISQGPIYDRTLEKLGSSDKGIILYRKIMKEQVEAVQRGEEPPAVMRGAEWERILDSSEKVTDGFMRPLVEARQ